MIDSKGEGLARTILLFALFIIAGYLAGFKLTGLVIVILLLVGMILNFLIRAFNKFYYRKKDTE